VEGPLPGDPRPEVGVVVTEPAVAKRVRHALHLAAEIVDGEVALDEGAEARIEP